MTSQKKEQPARRHFSRPAKNTASTPRRDPKPSNTKQGSAKTSRRQGSQKKRTGKPPRSRGRSNHTPPSLIKRSGNGAIPPLAADTVRIIPLGGVEEIGRNMTMIEYGDDIVVVDCGFQFKEEDTPGIDYILPNTQYLEDRRDKIRGVFITHGHLDHTGGIPYVMDRIGNPTIYTRRLTAAMIKKRQEEFAHLPAINIREVEKSETVRVGKLSVKFFAVTHTVPDSMGIIIETPHGDVVFTGDIKISHTDGEPFEEEKREYGIFKDRNVLLLAMDSTNVWQPGFSVPEHIVYDTLEEIIKNADRRLIIGMFASHLERLIRVMQFAQAHGKKIVIDGRSMKTNIEIARELGLIKYKDDTVISVENMTEYPPEKLIILATGAQGDEFASLARIGNKSHRFIRITPKDTVVLSSSVIPGNERAIQKLKDNISRQGARIITYHSSDVHASGHGNREEAAWIHRQIRPRFFMPLHGYHYMLRIHALLAEELGMKPNQVVVPDNGSIIEIQKKGEVLTKLKATAPSEMRVVEGTSIGELHDVLMRDRKALSQEGFCVVVATVDKRTGRLHKSPDIISRGFVYLRENKELMDQTRLIIRKSVEDSMRKAKKGDLEEARNQLADAVQHFLLQKTHKRPIVIPVIVSV